MKSHEISLAAAKRRLSGVLNRLVAQPAHETVSEAALAAGNGFARVPEPGACDFCLMLASRGAAYTRESVGRSKKFHDNCRCLGIEVTRPSDLPRINRELGELWRQAGDEEAFKHALHERRNAVAKVSEKKKALSRGNGKTARTTWIPADAVRIHAEPRHNRGRHKSVKSAEELREKGLIGHADTWKENNQKKQDREIWGREQRVIDWMTENDPDVKVERVARSASIKESFKTPDFVANGKTIDAKFTTTKKAEHRISEASQQAEVVILDMRGLDVDQSEVESVTDKSVREHGDRLDTIVVITDERTYYWERGSNGS
ncbi:hypothetical protein [Corynebacterium freneyi]|uniref:VG15 protein n=1 Tax=Corynebacterium freneyi TaxID=134034 RepID=UPI001EF30C58|nr:hypothetical protein [Corynebacterium freneyi]